MLACRTRSHSISCQPCDLSLRIYLLTWDDKVLTSAMIVSVKPTSKNLWRKINLIYLKESQGFKCYTYMGYQNSNCSPSGTPLCLRDMLITSSGSDGSYEILIWWIWQDVRPTEAEYLDTVKVICWAKGNHCSLWPELSAGGKFLLPEVESWLPFRSLKFFS